MKMSYRAVSLWAMLYMLYGIVYDIFGKFPSQVP